MSKYVIKNCDNYTNFDEDWTCRSTIQNRKGCYCCQDCTDCVLKQIVSRLNNFAEDYGLDAGFYADELLSYLDIQEDE